MVEGSLNNFGSSPGRKTIWEGYRDTGKCRVQHANQRSHNARERIGRCFDLARTFEIPPYSTEKASEKE
jgi:hypothetical protein